MHDVEGDLGRRLVTRTGCTILDELNWECPGPIVPNLGDVNRIAMRNGQLVQQYWNENRLFKRRLNVLGKPF